MRLQALAAMALPLLTCLIGCKVQTHAQIQGPDLQRQWSESIRRTGIQPIFPIREDVQGLSPVKWCNKSGQRSAAVPDVEFSS